MKTTETLRMSLCGIALSRTKESAVNDEDQVNAA